METLIDLIRYFSSHYLSNLFHHQSPNSPDLDLNIKTERLKRGEQPDDPGQRVQMDKLHL